MRPFWKNAIFHTKQKFEKKNIWILICNKFELKISCWKFLDILHGYWIQIIFNILKVEIRLPKIPWWQSLNNYPCLSKLMHGPKGQPAFSHSPLFPQWLSKMHLFPSKQSVGGLGFGIGLHLHFLKQIWTSLNISWVLVYRTCAIIILYIINPLFEGQNIYLRVYFLKIHASNMIIIREQFGL